MGFLVSPQQLRWYVYGYNADEVDIGLPPVDRPDDGKIQWIATKNEFKRSPELVSLPCTITGAIHFRPNCQDPLSAARGLQKRLVHQRPKIDEAVLQEFKQFVNEWLEKNITPLQPHEVPSFEEWLAEINQPEWRKKEYRAAWQKYLEGDCDLKKLSKKKCFVKAEFYNEPKIQRIIHSPDDLEKVLHGRYSSAMEKKLFERPEFIKKIPKREWPEYIQSIVGIEGFEKFNADYSSFEASFKPKIQRAAELAFARRCLANFLHDLGALDICETDRRRLLESKFFCAWIMGRRSSGQMETSLFNGFSNIMFNLFILHKRCGATQVSCVVEGDDGLFAHNGRQPVPEDYLPLNLMIKIIHVEHWWQASFCGVVTHPDVMAPLTDPWKVVCTASWAARDYTRSRDATLAQLAQVKGLSYLAQYPGCPVIQSIALWMLRTTGFERSKLDTLMKWYNSQRGVTWWEKRTAAEISKSRLYAETVMPQSRDLIAKTYGMSVETQLMLEERFDFDETGCVEVGDLAPAQFVEQYDRYVIACDRLSPELDYLWYSPERLYPENLAPALREDFLSLSLKESYKIKSPY